MVAKASAGDGQALRLFPDPPEVLHARDVYADLDLRGPLPGGVRRPRVVVNMVSTLDGKAAVGGKASPIGSDADRILMRNIRSAADAVVVGAGTVRAEEMNLVVPEHLAERRRANGLPGQPLGVVLSGSGDVPTSRKLFAERDPKPLVIFGGATPEAPVRRLLSEGVRVLRAPGDSRSPDPREVLALLRDHHGADAVLVEGGHRLNASFFSAGLVDELFLTLSPKVFAAEVFASAEHAPPSPTYPSTTRCPASTFSLTSAYSFPKTGELFLRYRAARPPVP